VFQTKLQQDVARRAFDTVAAMNEVPDLEALDAVFERFVRSSGFEQYATLDVHDPRRSPRIEVLRARPTATPPMTLSSNAPWAARSRSSGRT
jgi:hypothetical protein